MPRERDDFFRISNVKSKEKLIILAFEGNITEVQYFEALKDDVKFNNDLIHLHLLKRPEGDTNSAPNHVFNKLKKEIKDEFKLDNFDELRMIIDRDDWKSIPEIIELCKKESNFFVALSNPCFEIWLLLHIADLKDFTPEEQKEIFENKKISNSKNHIHMVLGNKLGEEFNKKNPRPDRFTPTINLAIERAESLDDKLEDYPTNLGTHVYKVVKKILAI